MEAITEHLSDVDQGKLLPKLHPTYFRSVFVQWRLWVKLTRLLWDDYPVDLYDTKILPVQHFITRPSQGFNRDLIESSLSTHNSILVYVGLIHPEEMKVIQAWGYKLSILSQSWNDSSYLLIRK